MYAARFIGVSVAPGAMRVDGDAVRGELERERPRQRDDAALGGDVGGEVCERLDVGGRADVEDPPTRPLLGHHARGGATAVEVPVQVGGEHAVPVLVRHLEQRLDEQPRRVVDPDVDATEAVDGRVRQALDVLAPSGVADQHERVTARLAHRSLGRRSLLERHARDVGAGSGERHGDRLPDAARGTGDDRAPVRSRANGEALGHRGVG